MGKTRSDAASRVAHPEGLHMRWLAHVTGGSGGQKKSCRLPRDRNTESMRIAERQLARIVCSGKNSGMCTEVPKIDESTSWPRESRVKSFASQAS
jgi:hypothetical protein